ncbi:glycosyltransferase family 2 protein [Kineococcus sp. NPDC059986]|uniref:glycosyltransferase family 2 protein n=1 Tax=Kineococcus sp. NPDC059986 TaxID=3155538 RepID=UPI003450DBEB
MLLSACLVVRDAATTLGPCLDSVAGVADEVVVLDTGSVDGTWALLRERPGIRSLQAPWTDDFAAARNAVLAEARGEWVFSVDADEVVFADRDALRRSISGTTARTLAVCVRNVGVDGGRDYELAAVRLFRREGARWSGRVHEQVDHPSDRPAVPVELPGDVVRLDHHGYADEGTRRRKGERNLLLAARELEDLRTRPGTPPDRLAAAVLDVGRSALSAGDPQRAVDAFEAVRDLVPSGPVWSQATDYLARVLLGAGEGGLGVLLADQLSAAGVDDQYCRWLRAQGLAQSGRPHDALAQLDDLTRIVDTAGRRHDPAALEVLRGLCREAVEG